MKLKGAEEPGCSTTYVVLAQSGRQFQVHVVITIAYGDDFCCSEVMKVVNKDEIEISNMACYVTRFCKQNQKLSSHTRTSLSGSFQCCYHSRTIHDITQTQKTTKRLEGSTTGTVRSTTWFEFHLWYSVFTKHNWTKDASFSKPHAFEHIHIYRTMTSRLKYLRLFLHRRHQFLYPNSIPSNFCS